MRFVVAWLAYQLTFEAPLLGQQSFDFSLRVRSFQTMMCWGRGRSWAYWMVRSHLSHKMGCLGLLGCFDMETLSSSLLLSFSKDHQTCAPFHREFPILVLHPCYLHHHGLHESCIGLGTWIACRVRHHRMGAISQHPSTSLEMGFGGSLFQCRRC